jgi:hypothetical protein
LPGLALLTAVLTAASAYAQTSDTSRFRVSLNGGGQVSGKTVSQSFSVQKNLESAPVTADMSAKRAPTFDGGIVVRIFGPLAVGFAVSYLTHDSTADITAKIPHPFFFNQPRTITGSAPVTRTEGAGHIEAAYQLSRGRVDVLLLGGPSIFNASQTLVTDVTYSDAFPFDTATFRSAVTATAKKTVVGFNVGGDVTWRFSRNIGIGGLIRYAQAHPTLSAANNSAVKIDVGGLQVGAGLRFLF